MKTSTNRLRPILFTFLEKKKQLLKSYFPRNTDKVLDRIKISEFHVRDSSSAKFLLENNFIKNY